MELNLHLHRKQGVAFNTSATEVLYGGAAGGGKSFLMRVVAILWCASIPGLQVYLFRRIEEDLIKNHLEGPKGFRALLAAYVNSGLVTIIEGEIRFWNGSKIYLCHCKDEKHRYKYLGAEIHVLLIDELTTFTEVIYRFLRNRVRAVGLNLAEQHKAFFPRILCSSNPGNIGHHWVKATFVDYADPYEIVQTPKEEGGMLRQYIPAKLNDNPSMASDDPGYEDRLSGLGSEALVRAMRDGDWSVIEGAFFDCWAEHKHVIEPFEVPASWTRICGFDWGSASPFSVGWWAVASDPYEARNTANQIVTIPRGALIRYREWYGAKEPNVGLKLKNAEIARGIRERELIAPNKWENISQRIADPSIFAEKGGPSINEEMGLAGCFWRPGDNCRVAGVGAIGGWSQVRGRMIGQDDQPMLYVFKTCREFIRTVPALQHDPHRPEDINTDMEDHIGDETRYVCNSRPWVAQPKQDDARPRDYQSHRRRAANSWKTA